MGGRGKTPVTIAIARHLVRRGERPAVLSRGYGRRVREPGVVLVSDGVHVQADLDRAGDEPLLIARAVPGAAVLVCEERATAAVFAETVLDATVVILDDGFQHRAMRRDVDLVIVTPEDLRDRRVPFGRLREPVSALGRADAVLVDGAADLFVVVAARTFTIARSLTDAVPLEADREAPGRDARVVAMAGIANPARFAQALTQAGWRVAETIALRDHHRYSARDLDAAAAAVSRAGAAGVLTTEKDAMRLLPLRPFPVPIAAVPLHVTVDGGLFDWLTSRLQDARERQIA
jgi:tetraacyldisaccharide 4'-kinase